MDQGTAGAAGAAGTVTGVPGPPDGQSPVIPVAAGGSGPPARRRWQRLAGSPWWARPALLAIMSLAAVTCAWGMPGDGIEAYYAAAVRSMAGSWHAFLYGSFDPQSLISLDKLPGAFWVQALTVRAFGLSVWAMVLPQVIWTTLTVPALFRAVRRAAGPAAGLAAALLLALSPVTIASARGNLADPLFVLLLVLAAGAVTKAAATGRLRSLTVAALWAGLAFQAKMAEAWLIAPACAAAYLAAAPGRVLRKTWQLLAAGAVLVAVSLAWVLFVTATPAQHRPYADGSRHNSVLEQVFSYNGIARFGDTAAHGLGLAGRPSAAAIAYSRRAGATSLPLSRSRPAWDRLVTMPAVTEAGWLLPAALLVAAAAFAAPLARRAGLGRAGRRAREAAAARPDPMRAALLLWGLWLITVTVVFSASHQVLSYYFAVFAPAIAALCALGLRYAAVRFQAAAWRVALAVGLVAAALWSCTALAEAGRGWRPAAIAASAAALVAGAAAACLAGARRPWQAAGGTVPRLSIALLAVTALAALTGPAIADGWLLANAGGAFDAPLNPAGTLARSTRAVVLARQAHPPYGGTVLASVPPALWRRLEAVGRTDNRLARRLHRPGIWFAVYGSAASEYVLAGVHHVLPIGGFTGEAPFPATARLIKMIRRHQIGWALVPGPGDLRASDPRVRAIVRACLPLSTTGGEVTARGQLYECSPPSAGQGTG